MDIDMNTGINIGIDSPLHSSHTALSTFTFSGEASSSDNAVSLAIADSTPLHADAQPPTNPEYAHGYVARKADNKGIITYPAEEHAIWHDLLVRQQALFHNRACQTYIDGLATLQVSEDHIPQLPDLDKALHRATGWQTAQVPALISFKRFFELLANRSFPVATFIRRREDFDYIQEPDIFHEIVGHCPMLTNPAFATFNEIYGKLGLTATKQERTYLARLYWFTVEFGLLMENGQKRIYGGGILSSPAETCYALSAVPQHREFNLQDVLRTPYRIDILQPIYYVIDSIDSLFDIAQTDIMAAVREAMAKPLFEPVFEPHPSLLAS